MLPPCVRNAGCTMTGGNVSPATTYVTIVFSYPQHSIKEKGSCLSLMCDFLHLIYYYPYQLLPRRSNLCSKLVSILVRMF